MFQPTSRRITRCTGEGKGDTLNYATFQVRAIRFGPILGVMPRWNRSVVPELLARSPRAARNALGGGGSRWRSVYSACAQPRRSERSGRGPRRFR